MLPSRGCAIRIVTLKRALVILTFVAEYGSAAVNLAAIPHQLVPVKMTAFMAEMAKQRAIGFAHGHSKLLPHGIIGFDERHSNDAIVMA